jgi:hypothetical protein
MAEIADEMVNLGALNGKLVLKRAGAFVGSAYPQRNDGDENEECEDLGTQVGMHDSLLT